MARSIRRLPMKHQGQTVSETMSICMASDSLLKLFRYRLTRAAELFWKILELGQAVLHAQHGFRIVDVHGGNKLQTRYCGGEYVHQSEPGMVGHQMAAALGAILPLASRRLLECRNAVLARRDFHRRRFPQTERVDRSAGPGAARAAMAITHSFRLAGDFDFDGSAETFAFVGGGHKFSW